MRLVRYSVLHLAQRPGTGLEPAGRNTWLITALSSTRWIWSFTVPSKRLMTGSLV
jgi:hypothetical protein